MPSLLPPRCGDRTEAWPGGRIAPAGATCKPTESRRYGGGLTDCPRSRDRHRPAAVGWIRSASPVQVENGNQNKDPLWPREMGPPKCCSTTTKLFDDEDR